jgi:hypothetical protein
MRELVVIEFMTLDGVVQAPGHAGEDTDDGFAQGGWTQPHMIDHRQFGAAEYVQAGDFLFGRRTYQIWLPHWSTVTDPDDSIAVALTAGQSTWRRAPLRTHPGPAPRSSPAMTSNERCSS